MVTLAITTKKIIIILFVGIWVFNVNFVEDKYKFFLLNYFHVHIWENNSVINKFEPPITLNEAFD